MNISFQFKNSVFSSLLARQTRFAWGGALAALSLALSGGTAFAQGITPTAPSDTLVISYKVPTDSTDPADLEKAAIFAWNQFIALTWPAEAQGPESYPRETPYTKDDKYKYGQAGPTGQVVWETFRHKVEIFPFPNSGIPPGYVKDAPDYGYDSAPVYNYLTPIPALLKGSTTPFNNLDESTEITLNAMYAGIVVPRDTHSNTATDRSQKILFQAKGNKVLYQYGVKTALATDGTFNKNNRKTYVNNAISNVMGAMKNPNFPFTTPYTDLPTSNSETLAVGTIELKAAWRRLGAKDDPTKFYTAPVRYYRQVKGSISYVDSNNSTMPETWGLIALHIIHKTAKSPSFVFTTFGHNSNILDKDGNDVEDPDGTTKPQYLSQNPFDPALDITPSANGQPQKVTLKGTGKVDTESARLYYHNLLDSVITDAKGVPYTDPVNINRRLFPIPAAIVGINQKAHALIKGTVWANYRLVNVQARALDKDRDAATIAKQEPTYYLANEVVESNATLQHFRGSLANSGTGKDKNNKGAAIDKVNMIQINDQKVVNYTMGGCMGCHGSQGQEQGGDFSVIFARYNLNVLPDPLDADEEQLAKKLGESGKYVK